MAGVNVPTNTRIKEQDINSKLQLYGIYSAFANGKVPSNQQIDVAMNTALAWPQLATPTKSLSTEGQHLVADLRDVIEKTKIMLLTKNQGNLLQDFIWQTQSIGAGDAKLPTAPIDKDTAQQHGQQALEGLRTLGTLLITNGQFRKLLSDATILLRDIAGDAAQSAATRVNPSQDQLAQIDHAAEDNTWHEAPDLSRDNIRNQIQSRVPIGKKDVQDIAGDATAAAHPDGSRDPNAVADLAAQDQQNGTQSGVDAKSGAVAGAQAAKNKLSARVPEEHKQKAREYRDKTNAYFQQKVPKERQDQIVFRLKKMVVEIQGHQDYQQAIDTLLRLAEEYTGHTKTIATQSHGAVKGAHNQSSLTTAEADLKTLLERFANGTSFDDLIDSINQIYADADRDPELKRWFTSMDRYVRRCLKEQGFILQDESNVEWNKLYEHGNFLLRDRYKNHTNRIFDEVKFLAAQFDEDPHNKAFANSMNKLFNDLGNDENGKPTFKPHLIKDLTEVIIPAFFENVRYVPIPRIEYTDKMVDLIIENLVIEGDNLAPNVFEFGSDNYFRWGRRGNKNTNKNKVMLSVSGVQMDLRDVAFYVKKKEGFPSITDKGVMDIFLGGTGLSFKVAMETADTSDKQHFFKINTVHVDIKHMDIKLKQSNHKLLFNLFKPLLFRVMRPVLQKVVEKQIRDQVTQLDSIAYKVKLEADRAVEEAKNNPDPENIQNIYQRYFTAFQRELQKTKKKTNDAVADKKVNVAMTQHDSLFQNIKLPGGISTKATEYKELAAKGDRWESPVFSIGSAKASSNLPSVLKVTRKSHGVTQGGVRGETGLDNNQSLTGQAFGGNQAVGGNQAYGANQSSLGNQAYGTNQAVGENQAYGANQSSLGNNQALGNSQAYGTNQAVGGNQAYAGNQGLNGTERPATNGFANQVNDAFQGDKTQDYGLNSASGGNGANAGNTGATAGTTAATTGQQTLLGKANAVLTGRV